MDPEGFHRSHCRTGAGWQSSVAGGVGTGGRELA
jgi:hypothetical protein